jgi:Putative peptidoglycan binding domain
MALQGNEPELGLGDSGEHVTELQDRLRGMGLLQKHPDGTFDDETQQAVRDLQSQLGLDNDGTVGEHTWQALDDRMLDQGLHYNPNAGAANQHWDQERAEQAAAGAAGAAGADAQTHWDGERWHQLDPASGQWVPMDAGPAEQFGLSDGSGHNGAAEHEEIKIGHVTEDGHWRWNGSDWEAAHEHGAASGAVGGAAGAEEQPVVPHIDNIHPAIQQDERFSSFHDFLRETHGT